MKEAFIDHKFSSDKVGMIVTINGILDEYRRLNFRLSLRQLYYQLVARGYIENSDKSYKNTGNLVSDARLAGLIDWNMIEDRGRETNTPQHWKNPGELVEIAAQAFRIDKWLKQKYRIEVMVEKDALSGVLEPVCRELDISITANKGYSSSSTMYEIGKRLALWESRGKSIAIIYLGDHDPSGMDMTRDVRERLSMFADTSNIEVIRIALNYDQVERWNPPPNPAKITDSRAPEYIRKYGELSWELDAIEPTQLAALVRDIVLQRRNRGTWEEAVEMEKVMRADLRAFADKYNKPDPLDPEGDDLDKESDEDWDVEDDYDGTEDFDE